MARMPVKLSRGEIVLPPGVTQQYRQRLEEMNAMGLQARAAGGVVAYRQLGGPIPQAPVPVPQPGVPSTPDPRLARAGRYGQALTYIGSKDFTGASDVLALSLIHI